MAIIRWYEQPDFQRFSGELDRIKREMNRLFSDFRGRGSSLLHTGVFPPVNLSEDAGNLYLRAELPGIQPEDIEICVEGETLTLKGERKLAATENVSFHRREREGGRFRRILSLPSRVNAEAVSAVFKNGVLKIVLPKAPEAQPKQIKVATG
jgi:HSP20 family protein